MNKVERCPHCGQVISKRKITLLKDMVEALKDIYKWCAINNTHEFTRKDIKHLLKTDNQIARFGDWVYFGGIIYKKEKGIWGINMQRANDFLKGKIVIHTVAIKNPLNGEVELSEYKKIWQVKGLETFLDEQGIFIPEYVNQNKLNL